MPNRRDGEPEWPDYQLQFFSADIDSNFIDEFKCNFREDVGIRPILLK